MIILGIETSCDETSVGIIENDKILINLIYTQEQHRKFGGVVPELASRAHLQNLLPLVRQSLKETGIKLKDLDLISATAGPGLIGALIVGYCFGKSLSYSLKKNFIPVNHVHAHLYSTFLSDKKPEFPFLALLVSGGNTALYLIKDFFQMELLGSTVDDAAGEAFDKVGKLLGLNYPAGSEIEKLASLGDENFYDFPVAKLNEKYNFSFSGLKTSVLRFIQKNYPDGLNDETKRNIAASFQRALTKALIQKVEIACDEFKLSDAVVVGGVAANTYLRIKMRERLHPKNCMVYHPELNLCMDNGAMIAFAGLKSFESGYFKTNSITKPFPN
ncbi:MAG: tRNA (adenosine(37)-N6)-threonylcarbamoyltransferase complex transferase subunit TsaD [Ignavibacteria bacterium]|nr:tRNA (adenosine(37)-N6)-threonylcarbamoyltransferase complex transferase subunit TsaD [Ignavibacteria bacterium]